MHARASRTPRLSMTPQLFQNRANLYHPVYTLSKHISQKVRGVYHMGEMVPLYARVKVK